MKNFAKEISIVCPVYKASVCIDLLLQRLQSTLIALVPERFEIILVNDGSPDDSWNRICSLMKSTPALVGINLSRNFGQHAAIRAGLEHATGRWIVVMDCDLQDIPEEIPRLYHKALEGFDVVSARRKNRSDSALKCFQSWIFYKILGTLTDSDIDHAIANFGIYNHKVIQSIKSFGDRTIFFPEFIRWVGFRSTAIDVKHGDRAYGKSSYTLVALIRLAFSAVISFSDKPLRFSIYCGLLIAGFSAFIGVVVFVKWLIGDVTLVGWTSLMLSLWFLAGFIVTSIGITALYIGRIFEQTKMRPVFVVSEIIRHET
jgi:glycosyltransferase involved in cell wall biosynthesis